MLLFINVAKIKTGIKGSYKMALRVGSLFSGIGGMELGLEKSGMQIIWQVEQDANCQNVLKKHWSNTNLYSDVKEVGFALQYYYLTIRANGFHLVCRKSWKPSFRTSTI